MVLRAYHDRSLRHRRGRSTPTTGVKGLMSNPYDNASEKVSVLGPSIIIKGELSADEDLILKGRVDGSINHTASLKISQEGSVKGDVKAKCITVEGTVEGDLFGSESVTVEESAHVTGDIYSPKVSLIEGARFKGSIDMEDVQSMADRHPSKDVTVEASEPEAAPKVTAAGGSN